jgi:predicted DNA-binding antitoxin AbrB/MazE fold protein
MSKRINAIFENGVLRPEAPVNIPNGERVSLDVQRGQRPNIETPSVTSRIHSPRLVYPEEATAFTMEVRETPNAGV